MRKKFIILLLFLAVLPNATWQIRLNLSIYGTTFIFSHWNIVTNVLKSKAFCDNKQGFSLYKKSYSMNEPGTNNLILKCFAFL